MYCLMQHLQHACFLSACPHVLLLCSDMFNITNVRGKVAKFCIFKTVYRLGEDIVGTFTFSEGDIPCLQVSLLHCCTRSFSTM